MINNKSFLSRKSKKKKSRFFGIFYLGNKRYDLAGTLSNTLEFRDLQPLFFSAKSLAPFVWNRNLLFSRGYYSNSQPYPGCQHKFKTALRGLRPRIRTNDLRQSVGMANDVQKHLCTVLIFSF